jgi:signal transduction histidine kinase/ABC-type multidrug transport system ATPase subunit
MTIAQDARPTTATPLLTVSNLSVSFGQLHALRGVSLAVRPGELVALAGENGAGKTTLVRCIAGDVAPAAGEIQMAGRRVHAHPGTAARHGIAVVWQDLALCDNLDIAANIMLGRESRKLLWSQTRLHQVAADLLAEFRIPLKDTTRSVSTLSGGQRQLVAVARAMGRRPRLIALDEPTAALGVNESRQVEDLIMGLREQGTTIMLACHDIEQMFRLSDRIVVLRQGQIVADLQTTDTHPEDVVALLSGQQVDTSARTQLTRLHGLTDRLISADPSSSLTLILSALGAALSAERLCIHLATGIEGSLYCAASLGFASGQLEPWARLPLGPAGGPVGMAAADGRPVIADNMRAWRTFRELAKSATVASSWSVPVQGPSGVTGVITVFRPEHLAPRRDEIDLITVYAGYAANAIERDRLLDQVTTRNRVLETIREMLETLAGPVPVADGLDIALQSLRRGLQAEEVAVATQPASGGPHIWRAYAGPGGADPDEAVQSLSAMAVDALTRPAPDGVAIELLSSRRRRTRAVVYGAAGGRSVLLASWRTALGKRNAPAASEETALMEDAAHSLRLALEREEAASAHQEAAALRRSRELQRGFLSRLSHELRTPLTAIRGYASSLMQNDVTWDGDSQQRFLDRIAAESARLGRLVDDLLDFSAIESGIMRLQPDWCDIRLVIDAAVACLPPPSAKKVTVTCESALPVIWADHDRMEQVLVNLLANAFTHNPPDTTVHVTATRERSHVVITVQDDGAGMPPPGSRSGTAGAGLGLSIARGIVQAHDGTMELNPVSKGTCFNVRLAIEGAGRDE